MRTTIGRLDAFKPPNPAYVTGRNTNVNVASQSDATRSEPESAGFGVDNAYQRR